MLTDILKDKIWYMYSPLNLFQARPKFSEFKVDMIKIKSNSAKKIMIKEE